MVLHKYLYKFQIINFVNINKFKHAYNLLRFYILHQQTFKKVGKITYFLKKLMNRDY